MAAKAIVYVRVFHDPLLNHWLCASWPLLCRLEYKFHLPFEVFLQRFQYKSSTQHHGHVSIMTTGVHGIPVSGCKRQTGFFSDRQRIHIGSEHDSFPRTIHGHQPHNPETGDVRLHRKPKINQLPGNKLRGFLFFERSFRNFMQFSAIINNYLSVRSDKLFQV